MHAQKPQNINDQTSTLEIHSGELHAKLLRVRPGRPQCRRVVGPISYTSPTGMENAGGQGRSAGGRWWGPAAVSTNNRSTQPKQISHAIPPRHGSMHAQKPQNINDQTSTLEIHSGELHAKLLRVRPGRPQCRRVVGPISYTSPTGIEAPEGPQARPRCPWITGPGCGAHGRRQGLAGQRVDAPSEARGADGSRAGRRPQVHQAARPTRQATRCPENRQRNATRSSPSEPCARAGASRPGRNGCGPRCAAPRLRCR